MDAALTLDQQLIDVRCRLSDMGVGWPGIALLMATHAHHAAAFPADISGRQRQVHNRRDGTVIVIAPDDAFLIGEHRATSLPLLRFGNPGGGFDNVLRLQSSKFGRILQRGLVRLHGLAEILGRGADEVFIYPAFFDDIGENRVEQSEVGAGIECEMEHVLFAGFGFASIDRHCAARIDENDPAVLVRLAWKLLLLFLQGRAAQIRHPMVQEIIGLSLQRIASSRNDRVRKLGVLIAIVELANAHVAGRMHLRIIGRAIVDADVLDLHRGEIELAGAPGVFVTAACAAMIEGPRQIRHPPLRP